VQFSVPTYLADFSLVTYGRFSVSMSRMSKFTVTGLSTQQLYYRQTIHRNAVAIVVTVIGRCGRFSVPRLGVIVVFVSRTTRTVT
jgi:hypothetical protein